MIINPKDIKLSLKQKQIIELLLEKHYLQNELQDILGISASALFYQLNTLEKKNIIEKKTIFQIGNAKKNKISLNPTSLQLIRKIMDIKIEKLTLITGYGTLGTGYRLPDIAYKLLINNYFKINRVVCFTSNDALKIRNSKIMQEKLIKIDNNYKFEYNDFRNLHSILFQDLEKILQKELSESNIIVDLTPMSKLFSFKLLELCNRFKLPCFYIGQDENNNSELIWMSNIKIEGEIKKSN